MLELNGTVGPQHQYQLHWMREPDAQFRPKVAGWLGAMAAFMGGPSKDTRKRLCAEFKAALMVYELMLRLRKTELQQANITSAHVSMMELTFAVSEAGNRIRSFEDLYRLKFGSDIEMPVQTYGKLQNVVAEVLRSTKAASVKRNIIKRKVRATEFWLHGVVHFNDHIDDCASEWQYLYNCDASQVKLILDIMTSDAARLMRLQDPTAHFKIETGSGYEVSSSVEWSEEDFKKTVKAEASVGYGVNLKATGEWEITGLKCALKAELFAGARLQGSVEGSYGPQGVELKGEVDAMLGVKVKFDASMEVLSIFALEVGGEAFAGALANAQLEFTATSVTGVKINISAEAFAGARISGSAKFEFKLAGFSILSGSATGTLSAGVGAAVTFNCEVSPMGGTKFGFGAELTVGLGGGAETEIEFEPGNLALAVNACYYRAYFHALRSELEEHAYREYFENLQTNKARLEKALEYFKICERQADALYDSAANAHARLGLIVKLADDCWDKRDIPMIRTRPSAMDMSSVKTGLVPPGRKRSNAVTSRPKDLSLN